MVEIVKVYKESYPALRLIGKRYTNSDRGPGGGYGHKWGEWHQQGYFAVLEQLGGAPEHGDAYVGCMRSAGEFEYWIGMFFPAGTPVPPEFMHVDIPAGDAGICWVYGREDNGELYGPTVHDLCRTKILEAGWQIARDAWVFERYNCPRFTSPDDQGKVILDYGVYLV
ncbi:MAG TPA: GyrI-like domain-containing protein [Firmicutes bacterium]|jgi:hypothetical protein|nr:GyrI-like domain-containing protein [Bacillota bacterium]